MAESQAAAGLLTMGSMNSINIAETDIMQADRDGLVDIRDIHIDSAEPVETRIRQYVEQARNPFLLKYGDYIIKLSYADTDTSMDDRMTEYVDRMAQIRYQAAGDFT